MTTIKKVNANINFNGTDNQDPKGGSNTGAALGTGLVGGGAAAFIAANTDIGKKTPTATDVFNNSELINNLPDKEKKAAEAIIEKYKNAPKEAEKTVKKHFKGGLFGLGKEKTEIKVNHYLHNNPERFQRKLQRLIKRQPLEGGKYQVNWFQRAVGSIWDNIKVNNLFNFTELRILPRGKKWRAARIEKMQNKLKNIQNAQNGKITKDAFQANVLGTLKAALTDKLDKVLEKGGKDVLTKIKDIRKITIISAVAAVLTFFGAKVFMQPKQSVAVQEPPVEEPDVEVAEASEAPQAAEEEKAA